MVVGGCAASLLGRVIRGGTAALEVVVVVADDVSVVGSTAAKLGRGVVGRASTALLSVGLSVGNDVEVDVYVNSLAVVAGDGGSGAAQVSGWVVGSVVATALEVSVLVGQDVVGSTAELRGWVVSLSSAAGEGVGNSLVVHGNKSGSNGAALLIVTQTLVSTALVGVRVGVLEDGVDTAERGGGVV